MSGTAQQDDRGERPIRLRLIADDLTGALDTAAPFAGRGCPLPVRWQGEIVDGASVAVDSGTRGLGRDAARATVARLVQRLPRGPGLFYAKLDSLLRGHPGAELAAWFETLAPAHCILAPAFPFQGRITRDGVQLVRSAAGWQPAATDLAVDLTREGLAIRRCRPGDPVPPGISLWDAASDDDLDRIAASGLALPAPVLWSGSGGLAAALARTLGVPAAPASATLPRPILGLFGTDHSVTAAQLAACGALVTAAQDGGAETAGRLSRTLVERGVALVRPDLPPGLSADEAADRIERLFADLAGGLDRPATLPATLIIAGGETLRRLCRSLGVERLDLTGAQMPGIPCSVLRGGRFDGVPVVSKSGAFGDPLLLRRLLAEGGGDLQGDRA